jgi:hypothetical protein
MKQLDKSEMAFHWTELTLGLLAFLLPMQKRTFPSRNEPQTFFSPAPKFHKFRSVSHVHATIRTILYNFGAG